MTTTAEEEQAQTMAVDAATEVVPETQPAKPVREKKPKEKKPRKPKASSVSHPPYFQMIKEALLALQDKGGSSSYAIAKYMEEKHKSNLPANFKKILSLQLKNFTAKGKLTKIKASFKLAETVKKEGPAKKTEKKPSSVKAKSTRPVRKASAAKKMGSAKPKQPKSIKSGAAKKTKKVA